MTKKGSQHDESPAVRIERAATELFGEKGLEGTSVREVARRADVTIGSINYYFRSKEALFRHCADRLVSEFESDLASEQLNGTWFPGRSEDERTVRLRRLIRAWVDLQATRDEELRDFGNRHLIRRVWAALRAAHGRNEGRGARASLFAYMGSMLIGAILTDEQLEHLTGAPASEVRARWRDRTMQLQLGLGAPVASAEPSPESECSGEAS